MNIDYVRMCSKSTLDVNDLAIKFSQRHLFLSLEGQATHRASTVALCSIIPLKLVVEASVQLDNMSTSQ